MLAQRSDGPCPCPWSAPGRPGPTLSSWRSWALPPRPWAPAGGRRRRSDAEQLDVEDQGARRTAGTTRCIAIGQVGWNPETALLSHHHQLQTFGPTLDHALSGNSAGWPRSDRAVEHLAVGHPAGVVHLDLVLGVGLFGAGALLQNLAGQALALFSASAGAAATSAGAGISGGSWGPAGLAGAGPVVVPAASSRLLRACTRAEARP